MRVELSGPRNETCFLVGVGFIADDEAFEIEVSAAREADIRAVVFGAPLSAESVGDMLPRLAISEVVAEAIPRAIDRLVLVRVEEKIA